MTAPVSDETRAKLYEAARKMGVETHRMLEPKLKIYDPSPRPDLEIAMECLKRLPMQEFGLEWIGGDDWRWYETSPTGTGTFIEAVTRLCERVP